MQPEETDNRAGTRKVWRIVFISSLILLAVFWSVDPSVFYMLTGLCAFSFFKVLQHRRQPERDEGRAEKSYQQTYYPKPSFWDELKFMFGNVACGRGQRNADRQAKIVRLVIFLFTGLILLSILIPILFSAGSSSSLDAWQQAKDLYERQQYDSAAYYYRIAIENDPDNAELYLEHGNAFLNAGKADSAMLEYDKALAIQPTLEGAVHGKGIVYYNRKQYSSAIEAGEMAVRFNPGCNDARLLIGDSFYNSSQLDSAMQWYEEAYANGYRSAGLSHVMAYIYDTKGNTQQAVALYKEAISYDTTRTEIYQRLGELVGGEEGNLYRQKAARYTRQ